MMDESAFIEKKTYDELMAMNVDNGVNIDKYKDLKMCSLEEYLEICKNYQMTPVIELKGENNTQYYNEIVNLAEKYNLKPVYISFHLENLKTMRKLDTKAKCITLFKKSVKKILKMQEVFWIAALILTVIRKLILKMTFLKNAVIKVWTSVLGRLMTLRL